MGRYVISSNLKNKKLKSTSLNKSNAFSIRAQSPKFGGTTKPLSNPTDKKISYKSDCNLTGLTAYEICTKLHKTLNISNTKSTESQFNELVKYYNRFKVATPNDMLSRGYAHVFFVRPDCNILNSKCTALNSQFENKPNFQYAWESSQNIVKQLVGNSTTSHDFALYLSNKAASFSLSDEYINYDTYGKTVTGYKVAYGRHNIESKSSGDFSVTFQDDRFLHIYQLNKLWVDYISMVYRGEVTPKTEYVRDKILDYASSVYYIVTAEDGETIIFWSKYYGVFPTTIPSTQFAWGYGTPITTDQTKFDIKYAYSFKEDYNPLSLVEFNFNSNIESNASYVPTYDPKLGHVGTTWVGKPYIELSTNYTEPDCGYRFKLRFTDK